MAVSWIPRDSSAFLGIPCHDFLEGDGGGEDGNWCCGIGIRAGNVTLLDEPESIPIERIATVLAIGVVGAGCSSLPSPPPTKLY